MRRSLLLSLGLLSLAWLGCNTIIGLEPGTPLCSEGIVCDDSNPCTIDTCGDDLRCAFSPLPDGKALIQVPGNCQVEMCMGGKPTAVDSPDDVPDDGEPCTKESCDNGIASVAALPDGTTCTKNGVKGTCSGGVCGCQKDADCDDKEPCTRDACDATTHACQHWPLDTTTVDGIAEKQGDCRAHHCVFGASTLVVDDSDAPAAQDACTITGCNSGSVESAPADAGAPCGGGGVCDGLGHCVECVAPTDCKAEVDGPCRKRTCLKNACGYQNQPSGTIPLDVLQPVGDCKSSACDGAGNLSTVTSPQDNDDANPCTSDACFGQFPFPSPVAAGQSCGGALLCDGLGNCGGCVANADCPGDFCRAPTCAAGKCSYVFTAKGTPLPANNQVMYDCQMLVCDGAGHTVTIADDADFVAGGCQGCAQGAAVIRRDQPCMGNTGYCTAAGQCASCTRDEQCPAAGPCQVAVCDPVLHQCGATPVKAGVLAPVAQQMKGDCAAVVCDGKGGTMSTPLPEDVPDPKGGCTSAMCNGGVPSFPNLPKGAPCGAGQACNGFGTCL